MATNTATSDGVESQRDKALASCLKQRELCQKYLTETEGTAHNGLVRKALLSAELSVGLLQMSGVDKTKALHQSLQKYIQSVLDLTYYQESCLVDDDFPSLEDIQAILDTFCNSISMCGSNPLQVLQILGEDIVECLHWRVGALLYMVTHTIINDKIRYQTANKDWLKECCRVGILHMKEIFQVRDDSSLKEDEEYLTNDTRLPSLLKQGIRSDTHMLALAYGGEMCHWYITINAAQELSDSTVCYPELYNILQCLSSIDCSAIDNGDWSKDVVAVGIEFLSKYIEAAEGNLRMQSWQCDRPKEILTELNKMITCV